MCIHQLAFIVILGTSHRNRVFYLVLLVLILLLLDMKKLEGNKKPTVTMYIVSCFTRRAELLLDVIIRGKEE